MSERRISVAEARRTLAEVLDAAGKGTPIEVTRNGEPIAAIVSIEQLRAIERGSPASTIARFRARVSPADLEGPDPFENLRDRTPGRAIAP